MLLVRVQVPSTRSRQERQLGDIGRWTHINGSAVNCPAIASWSHPPGSRSGYGWWPFLPRPGPFPAASFSWCHGAVAHREPACRPAASPAAAGRLPEGRPADAANCPRQRATPKSSRPVSPCRRLTGPRSVSTGETCLRRCLGERLDDAVDQFLHQELVVALAHDADDRLGAGRTNDEPAVTVEARFRLLDGRANGGVVERLAGSVA